MDNSDDSFGINQSAEKVKKCPTLSKYWAFTFESF
jgi:hypothetical protein